MLSQKCQYAIRATFELARRHGEGPVKICAIAETQAIPARFLEIILRQLKQAGFVQSRRGAAGGYLLARQPGKIAVGEIIQYVEGPLVQVECMAGKAAKECALRGNCAFIGMWERATKAISDVYNQINFQDLVDDNIKRQKAVPLMYSI